MTTTPQTLVPARPAAPWWGRPHEHRHAVVALAGSVAAGLVYLLAARTWAPDLTPGPVEFWGTVTSLWSVWITQRRNVLAMPVGLVSVVLMGAFFTSIGLIGQALLHWVYYVPVQLWAWANWTRGDRGGELPVTRLTLAKRIATAAAVLAGTLIGGATLDAGWSLAVHTYWDASVVAASVVAMLLLAAKKLESWWLWIGPVNVSAIGLYLTTGATMFAALYVLFLVMAFVGLARWRAAARAGSP